MESFQSALFHERIIVLHGSINDRTADQVGEALLRLRASNRSEPVTLYIKSPGGNTRDGLDICDMIRLSGVPVDGVVVGFANSMASVILQVCRRRMIARHAEVMIHNNECKVRLVARLVKESMVIDDERVFSQLGYYLRRQQRIYTIFAERSGQPLEEIILAMNAERTFSAEEAVAFGLADEVIDNPPKL